MRKDVISIRENSLRKERDEIRKMKSDGCDDLPRESFQQELLLPDIH